MDKSLRAKNDIVRIKRRVRILFAVFLLSLILILFIPFKDSNISGEEIANFHVIAKDLNLLNFESLLKKYSPQVKYKGNISLEADLKIEQGAVIITNGSFSCPEVSLSMGGTSLPLNFSNLDGDFEVKLIDGKPTIKGKIRSTEGQWGRLSFQDLEADYSLLEKKLDIAKCKLKLADGTMNVNGNIDFIKSPPFFDFQLVGKDIHIGSVLEKWGNHKSFSGTLSSTANISGETGNPTTYSGRANIKIEEGDLGKMGLIGRILTFSPLAAISRDFSLTTLEGDFDILEGYASTENTVIKGPGVKITANGDVGWNKKLDFILSLYASSELLKGTPITKALGAIVDNFGNVLRKIKLTGTIDNPEFTIIPLGIGDMIKEGFEKSFKTDSQQTNTP